MGMALAAIADDGDLLALDEVQVGVAIAWWFLLSVGENRPIDPGYPGRSDAAGRNFPALSRAFLPARGKAFLHDAVRRSSCDMIG
jgi:hypothetical protein